MQIIFITQYRENYGGDHWKNKGGSTYILKDVTIEEAADNERLLEIVRTVAVCIQHANDHCEEYIIDWQLRDDSDDLSDMVESWEVPTTIRRENGKLYATETIVNDEYSHLSPDIECIVKTYTMLPNWGREDYNEEVIYKEVA